MWKRKKEHDTNIFPLSCNPQLNKDQIQGLDIYYNYLDSAFSNRRIHNIAVTGPYGVGKSSILRSYDKQRRRRWQRKSPFLYVSLGNYKNPTKTSLQSAEDVLERQIPTPAEATPSSQDRSQTQLITASTRSDFGSTPSSGFIPIYSGDPKSSYSSKIEETSSVDEELCEKNAIERRLLLQIFSRFNRSKVCATNFKLIPEHPSWFVSVGVALLFLFIALLSFRKDICNIILSVFPCESAFLKTLLWLYPAIKASMYFYIFTLGFIILVCVLSWLQPKLRSANIAFKSENTEMSVDSTACTDYLDQYTQELIYALTQINGSISRTIVFEDMDRLPENLYISIFSRLREINHLVNARLNKRNYIRFIFVINEKPAIHLSMDKFFDYILPIIPELNKQTSEYIFSSNLDSINKELATYIDKEQLKCKASPLGCSIILFLRKHPWLKEVLCNLRDTKLCVPLKKLLPNRNSSSTSKYLNLSALCRYRGSSVRFFSCFDKGMFPGKDVLHIVSPHISDYRLQSAILNDYALLTKMYYRHNPECDLNKDIKYIAAFAIYKHLFPEDYSRVLSNEANISTGRSPDEISPDVREVYRNLQNAKTITLHCFYCACFSERLVFDLWKHAFETTKTNDERILQLQKIPSENTYLIPYIKRYFSIQQDSLAPTSLASAPAFISNSKELLSELINVLLSHEDTTNWSDNSWFFNYRSFDICLHTLEMLDHDTRGRFINWCKQPNVPYDIFKNCLPNSYRNVTGWNYDLVGIYREGVISNLRKNLVVVLSDGNRINLRG